MCVLPGCLGFSYLPHDWRSDFPRRAVFTHSPRHVANVMSHHLLASARWKEHLFSGPGETFVQVIKIQYDAWKVLTHIEWKRDLVIATALCLKVCHTAAPSSASLARRKGIGDWNKVCHLSYSLLYLRGTSLWIEFLSVQGQQVHKQSIGWCFPPKSRHWLPIRNLMLRARFTKSILMTKSCQGQRNPNYKLCLEIHPWIPGRRDRDTLDAMKLRARLPWLWLLWLAIFSATTRYPGIRVQGLLMKVSVWLMRIQRRPVMLQ